MTIKTKITLSFLISLVVASIVFVSFYAFAQRIARIEQQRAIINQVMKETISLNVQTTNYLIEPDEQIQEQWKENLKQIQQKMSSLALQSRSTNEIASQIHEDITGMEIAFDELVQDVNQETEEDKNSGNITTYQSFEKLFIRAELIVANALELDRLESQEVVATTQTRGFIALGGMTFLALVMIGNFLILMRGISRRLTSVVETTKEIAHGNLTIRLDDAKSKDEIGELARAFNTMTEELKSLYEGLEHKVRERTSQLAQAKAKDEAILKSMGDGLVVADEQRKIVLMNESARQMLDLNDQPIGQVWPDFLGKDAVIDKNGQGIQNENLPINQVLRNGKTIRVGNLSLRKNNGVTFPVAITVSPVQLHGKTIGTAIIFRDISRERAIDKAKSEFVSLASHQLRTPLSTIRWYSEMLLANKQNLTTKQKERIEEIYKSNLRMIDLVNALLNVSRLELGTFSVEPENIEITELIDSITQELKPQIKEKKIKLVKKYEKTKKIPLDPKLTRMILQNLISNAVKYTPQQGIVSITTKQIRKGHEIDHHKTKEDSIAIIIEDTGYGIPKDQQNQIFSKLYRADNVRKKDTSGTGLGLYIVKSILDHIGGEIWFSSVENKGTIFTLTIPTKGMNKKAGKKKLE